MVILSGITARYGFEGLQVATIMAGIILLVMGMTKMGGVIRSIPAPVIVGFTAGIGIIIWVCEWGDFFGLPKVGGDHFHQKLWQLLQALPDLHPATTMLALLSLPLLMVTPEISGLRRVPGPLVAMAVVTALQAICQFDGGACSSADSRGCNLRLCFHLFPVDFSPTSQLIENRNVV